MKKKEASKKSVLRRLGKALEGGSASLKRRRFSADVLAHELGHAKAFGKSGPTARLARKTLYGFGPGLAMAALTRKAAPAGKFSKKRALIQAVGEAPRLAEEAAASIYALKALKGLKYISPTQYKKARNNLLRAYGSYSAVAAGRTIGAGAGPMVSGDRLGQVGTITIGGHVGSTLGSNLVQGLTKKQSILYGGRGGVATKRQARALAKMMGVDPVIVSNRKTRVKNNAFYLGGPDVASLSGLLTLNRKKIGRRGMRKALADGLVTAPTLKRSEYTGGTKGGLEKALDTLEGFGKRLQKHGAVYTAAGSFGGALAGRALAKRKIKKMSKSRLNRLIFRLDKRAKERLLNTYQGRGGALGLLLGNIADNKKSLKHHLKAIAGGRRHKKLHREMREKPRRANNSSNDRLDKLRERGIRVHVVGS